MSFPDTEEVARPGTVDPEATEKRLAATRKQSSMGGSARIA